MLREVAQSAITKIKEAWPDGVKKQASLPSQSLSEPVGRGRPKKQAPPTQKPNHVLSLFNATEVLVSLIERVVRSAILTEPWVE